MPSPNTLELALPPDNNLARLHDQAIAWAVEDTNFGIEPRSGAPTVPTQEKPAVHVDTVRVVQMGAADHNRLNAWYWKVHSWHCLRFA